MTDIYVQIYRRMNPKMFPYSPYERQRELSDLWPQDQIEFRRKVDAILRHHEKLGRLMGEVNG